MTAGAREVWVFRVVHQNTGKPAQGVPVTVLDSRGDPAGYWVSGPDGTVEIPRRGDPTLRLRVGLRNEQPIELATAALGEAPTDLAAPTWLPQAPAAPPAQPSETPSLAAPPAPSSPPGHVLHFQRLVMFAGQAEPAAPLRYGVLVEAEAVWESLGVQWGDLLYSVSLAPGDRARLAVLDGRWRRDFEARERPIQILARMVGSSMLGDLLTALRPELQLDPLTLPEAALDAAAAETVQLIRDRTERMSEALRRRPLGVVDANHEAPSQAAVRTVRNVTTDRVVAFHFFEPLERFKVIVRTPRLRPVIFVPFRPPDVATRDMVRRFAYIFRRTLLDRDLRPELERLLLSDDAAGPGTTGRLFDHIAANRLYYSTAIIAAGDPAARHMALAKLSDPAGRPLAEVVENSVVGRVGASIALPLRQRDHLPQPGRDALARYAAQPPRSVDMFTVTIPHPGVWVSAQPQEPMQV